MTINTILFSEICKKHILRKINFKKTDKIQVFPNPIR